jgi:2-oxoglutarate ferredoxin oxidoreductase subunit gamma
VVSTDPIAYPYITTPSIMIVMSQEAYTKFSPELGEGGILITEEELVKPHNLRKDLKHLSIPATRFAEELGRKMVLNIVMMGFWTSVIGLIGVEAMRSSVKVSVPRGTEMLNLNAFNRGYEYGLNLKTT